MKRRLRIALALAALLALVWCGAAIADNHNFTRQPGTYSVYPDSFVTVSWATDFVPVRVEIGYDLGSYQIVGGESVWVSNFYRATEITIGLNRSMSGNVYYRDAAFSTAQDKWVVRAYYTGSLYQQSSFFTIQKIERTVSTPANTSVAPESSAKVSWTTNFTPIRVEIGYDLGEYKTYYGVSYWESDFRVATTITTGLSRSMSGYVDYEDAVFSAAKEKWVVRAFYQDGALELYETSDFFTIYKFAQKVSTPASTSVVPDSSAMVSWTTNFTPIRVEIGYDLGAYRTVYGMTYWDSDFHAVTTITTGLSRSMSGYVDYDDTRLAVYQDQWVVRAFYMEYGTLEQYTTSDFFTINRVNRTVSTPASRSINPGTSGTVSWTTNFTPVKVELGYDAGSNQTYFGTTYWVPDFHPQITITSGLSRSMTGLIPYSVLNDAYSDKWKVRAYYGDNSNEYDESGFFTITRVPLTVSTPEDCEVLPGSSVNVSWTSNFLPVKAEIGYDSGYSDTWFSQTVWFGQTVWISQFHPKTTITTSLNKSMSGLVYYNDATFMYSDKWKVRLYYDSDDSSYVESNFFSITPVGHTFTLQPVGGVIGSSGSYEITWATSFAPTAIEIYRVVGDSDYELFDTLAASATSYSFSEADVTGVQTFFLRAWRDSIHVASHAFSVGSEDSIAFVVQPQGATVGYGESHTLTWALTAPVRHAWVERRAIGSQDSWANCPNARVLGDQCSAIMSYSPAAESYEYRVRVTIGTDITVTRHSDPFYMNLKKFTLSFDMMNHGTQIDPVAVPEHMTAAAPSTPTESGWIFMGWYTEREALNRFSFSTPITADTTLYALWGHQLSFDINIGMLPMVPSSDIQNGRPGLQNVRHGGLAECPAYYGSSENTYSGWHVDGWYTESSCVNRFNFAFPVTQNMRLYAHWVYNGSQVTYNWNGSHGVYKYSASGKSSLIDSDAPVTLRVPADEQVPNITPERWYDDPNDYAFTGWYTEPGCVNAFDFTAPHPADITLYAGWAPHPVITYVFNTPGWENESRQFTWGAAPSSDTAFKDSEYQLPRRTGWTRRDGWFTDAECTVPFDADAPLYENVTLYLGWDAIDYTVTFDGNGSDVPFSQTLTLHYGDTYSAPDVTLTRANYYFNGWSTRSSEWVSGSSYDSATCTGSLTLYAVWHPDGMQINSYYFPDENFRAYLQTPAIDQDENGFLTAAEINAVTSMDYRKSADGQAISDLTGIGYFTELTTLHMHYQAITSLDLSRNTKLTNVYVDNCRALQSMNLANCTELTVLEVQNTALTQLDASMCAGLQRLLCENDPLTSICLRSDALKRLSIYNTGLQTVDISACPILCDIVLNGTYSGQTTLFFAYYSHQNGSSSGQIQVTNEDPCPTVFITAGVPIDQAHFPDAVLRAEVSSSFDLNHNGYLSDSEIAAAYYLSIYDTYLHPRGDVSSLHGVEYLTELEYLIVSDVALPAVDADLSQNTKLKTLSLSGNCLEAVDVSMLPCLNNLDVHNNPGLTVLVLGDAPLQFFECYQTPDIRELDLSRQPMMLKAYVDGGQEAYETYVSYRIPNRASLNVDPGVNIGTPGWEWYASDDVSFFLPNGTEIKADVAREDAADGKSFTCTATVTFGADGGLGTAVFTDTKTFCTVTFMDGSAELSSQELELGSYAVAPEPPTLPGFLFDGWYIDSDLSEVCRFDGPVTESLTLYASWLDPSAHGLLILPAFLEEIGGEAFSGIAAEAVFIPAGVASISGDPFAGGAVRYILGFPGTAAETFAAEHPDYIFVPVDNAWLSNQ